MTYETHTSKRIYEELRQYVAGGVSSNERMRVEPHPIVFARGKGSRLYDIDGNEYIDYNLGFGPLILGHSPEPVIKAVLQQIEQGTQFGAPTELTLRVAKKLVELVPCLELIRFSQSGTEAVQGVVRTARAYSGKTKIIKFEGHYHGWVDNVNISYAPSNVEVMGPREDPNKVLTHAGQSSSVLEDVIILPWNDLELVEKTLAQHPGEIAAVLTEPIMCNAGVILPKPGYLEGLRQLTHQNDILLIFDEVITGFRVALNGAQGYYGVTPDLATFAKAMAGGFPGSCFGGRADVMAVIAKGAALHGGTYNANPLVLAAMEATLDELSKDNGAAFRHIGRVAGRLRRGLEEILTRAEIPYCAQGTENVFGFAFTGQPIHDYRDSLVADAAKLMRLRQELRRRGIYTKPTPRDIWYISTAHTNEDVDRTLEVVEEVVSDMA